MQKYKTHAKFGIYSKNRITSETLELLLQLAEEVHLKDAIQKYFSGEAINKTENRKKK